MEEALGEEVLEEQALYLVLGDPLNLFFQY